MCIVVVEDDTELRELVTQVLEDEGYKVLSFSHPVPVTKLTDSEDRPQLFLVDVMLPEVNGISLAARLMGAGFETTPKIAMSASQYMLRVAKDSNLFDATLDKPFEVDALLACVERYTED